MPGPTIVSVLFDLASREPGSGRRSAAEYLELGEFLFGLRADLICFLEPRLEAPVRAGRARHGLADRTSLIVHELEDLPAYGLLGAAQRAREQHPILNADPAKDTPLHAVLTWSRFELLTRAVALNPFGAEHFVWVDFGLAHVARTDNVVDDGVFEVIPDDVRMLQMRPFNPTQVSDRPHHLQYRRGHFAAGCLSGSAPQLGELSSVIAAELESALADRFAPLDEQLLELAVARAPGLFSLYCGDYDAILANFCELRCSGPNLLYQLQCWRGAEQWSPAAELATRILESVLAGRFLCDPSLLARLLEECFIASYYAHGGGSELARSLAAVYARLAHADPDFREEFLRHEIRVRTNLAFAGQSV